MTKEEAIDLILKNYNDCKNKNAFMSLNKLCKSIECDECLFRGDDCVFNLLIELLNRFTKTEEKKETNFDHYYDGKLAFDDFANTGDKKLIADIYTLCFKTGTDEAYKKSGIYDFKRWLLAPYKPPKPKYKLSKFEYDLLESLAPFDTSVYLSIQACFIDMQEKGYFKGVPSNVTFNHVLKYCEVIDE